MRFVQMQFWSDTASKKYRLVPLEAAEEEEDGTEEGTEEETGEKTGNGTEDGILDQQNINLI